MAIDLTLLKSKLFCNIKPGDTSNDDALTALSQMVTARMISYIQNPSIDPDNPPLPLQFACMKQTAYEWRQRETPGLEHIQLHDGSINKFSVDEWLKDVRKILNRYQHFHFSASWEKAKY